MAIRTIEDMNERLLIRYNAGDCDVFTYKKFAEVLNDKKLCSSCIWEWLECEEEEEAKRIFNKINEARTNQPDAKEDEKYNKVESSINESVVGKRFENLEELNKFLGAEYDVQAKEANKSNQMAEDLGTDYSLVIGINKLWGFVEINYILDNSKRMYITYCVTSKD
ncbi:hypothetical protein [Poseidonibacter ostreae]|uniref:Uncharacterized protein n=1 Tax=Poseidonibacter ostreae TaxID=2654171 RepID=A0A6L4WX76_9BACT|nr:hypothetical protein [Poseidonibacter ostreae]KAB7891455.1 hypothetical protein GBG19_01040 [Poseidonibacter ostreae]